MKNRIAMLLIIVIVMSFFGTACGKQTEYVDIPVPDESQVEIDPVTLEQIEERARELEKKYCTIHGTLKYEDIFVLLVAANYEYLSEDSFQRWHNEKAEYSDNPSEVCLDYRTWTGFTWEFIYDVNKWGMEVPLRNVLDWLNYFLMMI